MEESKLTIQNLIGEKRVKQYESLTKAITKVLSERVAGYEVSEVSEISASSLSNKGYLNEDLLTFEPIKAFDCKKLILKKEQNKK